MAPSDFPIAEIAFNLASGQSYDYLIPPELRGKLQPGSRVTAPFRTIPEKSGYVIGLKAVSSFYNLRAILRLEDASRQIPPNLMKLADWMCDYYCAPHECVVWNLLPAVVRKGEMQPHTITCISVTDKGKAVDSPEVQSLTEKRRRLIETLLNHDGTLPQKELLGIADAGQSVIDALIAQGFLAKHAVVQERNPFADIQVLPDQKKALTAEQSAALKDIIAEIDAEKPKPILLQGVTGSGKTEVYLQAIDHCLKQGKDAIVLVPEIALTPQTATRFIARFGPLVSVLHSGLTDGQRFDEWTRINSGRSRIAIGARSALFAPFRNIGIIVVDEEHESTYKQDGMPHYHARDVAVVRAVMEKCAVVLGSATPSMESYHNCQTGKYRLVQLAHRVDGKELPVIELVDMREDGGAQKGGEHTSPYFSRRLTELIYDRLAKQEQVILFLNRRGFASTLTCGKCGWTAQCDNCSHSYTFHRKQGKLLCHLCGDERPAPESCPACGNTEVRYGGFGTERIEATIRALFPKARAVRMDSDSMTDAASYYKVLSDFRARKYDLLIGTQMIAKGLDFPDVTLVGIIQADIGLNSPDFRSAERVFSLVTQVAGRAGRGDKAGRVIVQTYTPRNYALQSALRQDYSLFYDQEAPGRQAMCFPPFAHIALVEFKAKEEGDASASCNAFCELLEKQRPPSIQVIGPMPAPIARVATQWRYHVLLRSQDIRGIVRLYRAIVRQMPMKLLRKSPADIDVDAKFIT